MVDEQKLRDLADEYASASAKARVEGLYGTSKSYTKECVRMESEAREALMAELQTLREERTAWRVTAENAEKDAARYRWLRDTNLTRPDMTDGSRAILPPNKVTSIWHGLPEDQWDLMGGCLRCSKGDEFDAAIDAAIKGETP